MLRIVGRAPRLLAPLLEGVNHHVVAGDQAFL